jgi:CRISPR/Cas system-associated exonuclease Cas4 (RecB family)
VNGTYDMKSVCEKRRDLYVKLVEEKKGVEVDLVK